MLSQGVLESAIEGVWQLRAYTVLSDDPVHEPREAGRLPVPDKRSPHKPLLECH